MKGQTTTGTSGDAGAGCWWSSWEVTVYIRVLVTTDIWMTRSLTASERTKHQKITGHRPEFSDGVIALTLYFLFLALFNDKVNSRSGQRNGNCDSQRKNSKRHQKFNRHNTLPTKNIRIESKQIHRLPAAKSSRISLLLQHT